jgi:uncharacterized protein YciI
MSGDISGSDSSSDERLPEEHGYVVALLRRVADRPPMAQPEIDRIRTAHEAHLARLHHAGELVISGSVEEERELRELLIFRSGPLERIRGLLEVDPVVQHRRLALELFTWSAAAGLRIGPAPRTEPGEEP